MPNHQLVALVNGREAIPVRAIPYITGWSLSPDAVARGLARAEGAPFKNLDGVVAFHAYGSEPKELLAKEWEAISAKLAALEAELKAPEQRNDVGYARWRAESIEKLPPKVFVWRDKFEESFEKQVSADKVQISHEREGDRDLNYSPMIDDLLRSVVMNGFHCNAKMESVAGVISLSAGTKFVEVRSLATSIARALCPDPDPNVEASAKLKAHSRQHEVEASQRAALNTAIAARQIIPSRPGNPDVEVLLSDPRIGRAWVSVADLAKYVESLGIEIAVLGEPTDDEMTLAWLDYTMDADMWFGRGDISPREAAMLLCSFNPLKEDSDPEITTTDETDPDDFKRLLGTFEDSARTHPGRRTLTDWHLEALGLSLKHHSWIADYIRIFREIGYIVTPEKIAEIEKLQTEVKVDAGRYNLRCAADTLCQATGERADEMTTTLMAAATAGKLPVYEPGKNARYQYGDRLASRARDFYEEAYWHDLNDWLNANETKIFERFQFPDPEAAAPAATPQAAKVITKQEVIKTFAGLHFDRDAWSKALSDAPLWLEPCRVNRGVRGKKAVSATWNPVLIAVALIDKGVPMNKLDAVFVVLRDWADEWSEKTDSIR